MVRKWLPGLLALSALLYLLFRSMMKKASSTNKALPIRNNNPFSIIQPKPDAWQGLTPGSKDFLSFVSVKWGVRAGYINLVNGYFKKGLNTLSEILPRYAPASAGNNPEAYISMVEKFTGIPRNQEITKANEIYALGRAIERVEAGKSWVDAEEWDAGWTLAIPSVKSVWSFDVKKQTQKATAVAGSIPL